MKKIIAAAAAFLGIFALATMILILPDVMKDMDRSSQNAVVSSDLTAQETVKKIKKPKTRKLKIACVGDSLTYGTAASDPSFSYPEQLQAMLGDSYEVKSFGLPAASANDNSYLPFITSQEYADSLKYKADIVILMLGTNDAKPVNWNGEEIFKFMYKKIAAGYKDSVVYAVKPIHCWWEIDDPEYTRQSLIDVVCKDIEDVARSKGFIIADPTQMTAAHRDWYQDDNVHLTDEGYQALAVFFYALITHDVE